MKRYLFLLLIALCMVITGCSEQKQNTPSNPTNTKKTGYIQFINNSSDPYSITIKGNTSSSFSLDGKNSITKTVEVGYYNVHVKQQMGYILYPTEKDYEFYVKEDQTQIVSFNTTL